eukprot:9376036-Prorocentrum_lima.AAC.1
MEAIVAEVFALATRGADATAAQTSLAAATPQLPSREGSLGLRVVQQAVHRGCQGKKGRAETAAPHR